MVSDGRETVSAPGPKDSVLHQKLSEISQKCHQLKIGAKEKEIEKLEKANGELVKKLFKITK